jgi:hypothetical protein
LKAPSSAGFIGPQVSPSCAVDIVGKSCGMPARAAISISRAL